MQNHPQHKYTAPVDIKELGEALRHCHDLTFLQNSRLTGLPCVVGRCRGETAGLDCAKALRKELIAASRGICRQTEHVSIRKILKAIEQRRLGLENRQLMEIQGRLGIPFSRDRIDLARYYAIRLVMEGLNNEAVAEFLLVEPRTCANYIAQAKIRIGLVLGCR